MGQYRGTSCDVLRALSKLPHRLAAAFRALLKRRRADDVLSRLKDVGTATGGLGWQDFETLVVTGFQHRGFLVLEPKDDGLEQDAEWVMVRSSGRYLVQCKHWRAREVNLRVIRNVVGAVTARRMAGGFVVTSGTFTKHAQSFAAGRNIELIDGRGLEALLEAGRRRVAEVIFAGVAANGPETAPYCPACRTPMVVRAAKRGANAGSFFWACAQFPICRQTMVMWSEGRRSA